jgi:D-alanyl-D-alanine carboxypeptidase/D-alanyl-D-alanine-endopeptidase (penicillin-binding protein 4)
MSRPLATLAARLALVAGLALAAAPAPALAAGGGSGLGPAAPAPTASGGRSVALTRALNTGMHQAGAFSGAEVADLSAGRILYAHHEDFARLPASVEKLFTTSTVLDRFGVGARLTTSVLGAGQLEGGTWRGPLYLRGGGDPTFGTAAFDQRAYGTGATVEGLVAGLRARGITAVRGPIVADATLFDSLAGTPAEHGHLSTEVEGGLSALAFDRDWANSEGTELFRNPALDAGDGLVDALRAGGIAVPRHETVRTGRTPAGAIVLASVHSPTIAQLVALTNGPSDNFFAETLLKDVGARFGGAGTTVAGAGVVRSEMQSVFDIDPRLDDGSGLSRFDRTTPAQVISLLSQEQTNPAFTNSLAIAGVSGTLVHENRHTYAQGRCRGKTGTLHDVSNVVGYCHAQDGHLLAYAFLMNGVDPVAAHPIQDRMQVAVARYDG